MLKLKWIRAMKNHPLAALTAGLAIGALISSISVDASEHGFANMMSPADLPVSTPDEISPDDLARELGLPLEDGGEFGKNFKFSPDVPTTRTVSPDHYKDFRLTVDVFRRSTKNPVLGKFRDEYIPALVPNSAGMSAEDAREAAMRRFDILDGKEFAIVSIDGKPVKANIISAAVEDYVTLKKKDADGNPVKDPATGEVITYQAYKSTPPGAYRLDALPVKRTWKENGTSVTKVVANPWIRSQAYDNSQMFWALWIHGGYMIHSTPHYGQLGTPASMGCIRQSFPDAMELFSRLVQENYTGMIRIHKMGTSAAVARARELIFDAAYTPPAGAPTPLDITKDMSWLVSELRTNWAHIRDTLAYYGRNDIEILGHSWIDRETHTQGPITWPVCTNDGTGTDCFKPFRMKQPVRK